MTETLYHDPDSELWFAWNGAHTVNVRYEAEGQDVDCYSIGNFPNNEVSYNEFIASIPDYMEYQD
jgi:hypothetical protein